MFQLLARKFEFAASSNMQSNMQSGTNLQSEDKLMKLYKWHEVAIEQLGGGITRQLLTVDNMMLAQIFVPKGVSFPAHRMSSEQVTIFVKGRAVYESNNNKIEAHAGNIVHIPAGTEHSDQVVEDTLVLDIFSPPRQDWLKQ